MKERLIKRDQFKVESWQNKFNAGGQHTNGPPPFLYVEHLPTGVGVILPNRSFRGGLQALDVALDTVEFVLTHPGADRLFESYARQQTKATIGKAETE